MSSPLKQLADITLKIGSGATPLGGSDAYHEEGISLVRSLNVYDDGFRLKDLAFLDEVQAERLSNVELASGDVLLNITGASIARCCVVPDDVLPARVNQHVSIIRPDRREIDPFYLRYQLISPEHKEALLRLARAGGSTREALTKAQIEVYRVLVPPLPDQQRIVGKLDAAFAALSEAQAHVERNRANARELFESYLNGVFEGKDGWKVKSLGELGKVSMCKRILKQQTSPTGDIPFYKIGTFGKEPDAFIPKEIYNDFKRKYPYPKKGDVLISASGTIGRGVVFDGEPAYFQDSNIVWIENDESQVLNEYLFQFYKVCDWNPSKGATISRLYNDDLRRVKIAFPSLQEQRKLVSQMVELDAQSRSLEATYQQKLTELAGLKKAVLGAAFRGEL